MDSMSGADSGGSGAMAESSRPEAGADADAEGASPEPGTAKESAPRHSTLSAAPPVASDSLRRDLRFALDRRLGPADMAQAEPACALDEAAVAGEGTSIPVTLDGRPALAVYREPRRGRQRVDVYLCGTGLPAHSVTLPAR